MTLETAMIAVNYRIKQVDCQGKLKDYLITLGFFSGATLCILSKTNQNLIVSVKDGRYALDKALASRITLYLPTEKESSP